MSTRGTRKDRVRDSRARVSRPAPSLDALEDRVVPTSSPVSLGAAAPFGVLGLPNAHVLNFFSQVNGNEGISHGGTIQNVFFSKINGNVTESSTGQYSGGGKLTGTLTVNSSLLSTVDSNALGAASAAAALTPTQTFGAITHNTTINGNGGLNVIAINGSIHNTLTLHGTASDVFIVNVTGTLDLFGNATLALSGGVTANHVLYNFTGNGGTNVVFSSKAVNGTLLAPNESFFLDGTFNGEVIGGREIDLLPGAVVNQVSFSPPVVASTASLTGTVTKGGQPIVGVTVTLTGTDSQNNPVTLTATTNANGVYSFPTLAPGTYTIDAPVVSGYTTNTFVGTVNSVTDGTMQLNGNIAGILLAGGDQGVAYDFTEILAGS